jgi:hypothetical protein
VKPKGPGGRGITPDRSSRCLGDCRVGNPDEAALL